jgi:hypothetical protein
MENISDMIADLAGSEVIIQVHLAEALQYIPKLELLLYFILGYSSLVIAGVSTLWIRARTKL